MMRLLCVLASFLSLFTTASALGQQASIAFTANSGAFQLAGGNGAAALVVDGADWPGVVRAAQDLAMDFGRVTGTNLTMTMMNGTTGVAAPAGVPVVIAGTIGKSTLINAMVSAGKLNVSQTMGKWESFQTQIVSDPMDGMSQALVIAGSDKRGAIYGIYDVSEQIGVSPWYWWADVPAKQQKNIYAMNMTKIQGPPSVKYRGFFINDEQPALDNWVNQNFPGATYKNDPSFTSSFYELVYELLLRLRANYLWPAEWGSIFYLDDPQNLPMADMYGVVIGTSHTEPMMRWTNEQSPPLLNGSWNWATNNASIYQFMKEGAMRSKPYEVIYSMGMRGLGDVASPTITAPLLGNIIQSEQQILSNVYNTTNLSSVPQSWVLYKEVGSYYAQGLRVPDSITTCWADDNWGNAQRLPLANETSRSAGNGLYYHFDYVGVISDYKWIDTISLQKTWEQMHLAYERGTQEIWVVNVGDIKPLEVPINHFFDLAYDMPSFSAPDSTLAWLNMWATREFGAEVANATANVRNTYSMLAARRKYEIIDPSVYSLINYNEAENVLGQWQNMTNAAQTIYNSLSPQAQPAFFELVLHPCMAGYTVNLIHITAARNNLYGMQRRTSTNMVAQDALNAFNMDHNITTRYHMLLNGKWNHMMDQTHLGYNLPTYWQQPERNTLDPLMYVQLAEQSLAGPMGVSIESSNATVDGDDFYHANSNNTLAVPPMDPYGPTRWIDVFSRGTQSFSFNISSPQAWLTATPSTGTLSAMGSNATMDMRIMISIDWANAPNGSTIQTLNITNSANDYGNYNMPTVNIPINKTMVPSGFHGFVESDATVSIEAEHFARNTSSTNASYAVIPGYGRTLSGVTLLPVLAPSQSPPNSPRLEYNVYFFSQNVSNANISVYMAPSLNTDPSRPLKYAIALDNESPQMVQPIPSTAVGTLPPNWNSLVGNGVAMNTTMHGVTRGNHTLSLWAMEPGVVFQKVVVDLGGVRPSYLGPPESMRV